MSKILLIGDYHIGMSYPNNYQKWLNVAKQYFDEFLLPLIKKELTKDDMIVQLGDLLDNRNFIPIDVLNYAQFIIEEMSKICQVHILVGNHDCWHKSSSEINSISLFKYIPNVFVYDKTSKIKFSGKSILMMPYIEKKKEQIEILQKYSGCDYLFCHSDLNGAKMHLSSVANKNLDKIGVEEFSGYKNVKTAHIHIQQTIGNVTFVGSVYEMDRNDMNNQKGIFILDTKKETERFIENNVSPKFRKVYIRIEKDIESLDDISIKDYIDLFISNSLLINNRKLRRKLEILLETGNFASVDYIDDINIVRDEKLKDMGIDSETGEILNEDITIPQLEYKDFIKEYILKQKWDSEKIKGGIIHEFDEIIKIYNDGYKD